MIHLPGGAILAALERFLLPQVPAEGVEAQGHLEAIARERLAAQSHLHVPGTKEHLAVDALSPLDGLLMTVAHGVEVLHPGGLPAGGEDQLRWGSDAA